MTTPRPEPLKPLPRATLAWLRARAPWLAALVTLATILLTERSGWPVGVFYDDGIYLDLARSLIAGEGYRHAALPDSPRGVHYPPLFPMWLAAWSWLRSLFGPHDVVAWLKLGNSLLAALAVALWSTWAARRLALHVVVASLLSAASVLIVPARAVTSTLFSEPLSWVLLALALLLGDAPSPDEHTGRERRWMGALVAGLLSVTRSALLPFSIAAALDSLRARSLSGAQRVGLAAVCLTPALIFAIWTMRYAADIPDAWRGNYGTYASMWRESWSAPSDLVALAGRQLGGFWRIAAAIWSAPGAVIALLALAAGLVPLWRAQRWAVLGLAGYVLLVLIWPIEPDRFVWGLLPLIALVSAAGVSELVRRFGAYRPTAVAGLLLVLLPLGACGRWTARGYANRGWIVPQEIAARNASPLVGWGRTLPRDAIVLTGNDPLFALATGLRAAPALPPDLGEASGRPRSTPASRLEASACALGRGWLAIGDSADQVGVALRAAMRSSAPRLSLTERVQLDGAGEAWRFGCP